MKLTRRRSYSFDPLPKVDQAEQRRRRRAWLPNTLDCTFDLTTEIEAIVTPLAARVASDPVAKVLVGNVADLADAVTTCCQELDGLFAADADQARVRHLTSEADRARALDLLRSRRAASAPEFTAANLADGCWAAALVALAEPTSEPLSRFLGRSRPDTIPTPTSVVEASLRGIDRAALSLERRLDRRASDRAMFASTRSTPTPTVEAELERLGVSL